MSRRQLPSTKRSTANRWRSGRTTSSALVRRALTIGVAVAGAAFGSGAVLVVMGPASAQALRGVVTLDRSAAPAGERVVVTGSGCVEDGVPGEVDVAIGVVPNALIYVTVPANAEGDWRAELDIPVAAPRGTFPLTAVCFPQPFGEASFYADASFTILDPAGPGSSTTTTSVGTTTTSRAPSTTSSTRTGLTTPSTPQTVQVLGVSVAAPATAVRATPGFTG